MAYAPAGSSAGANPPFIMVQPMAIGRDNSTHGSTVGSSLIGGTMWGYISSHTQAEVGTSDFVTDGSKLGMKQGDILWNMQIAGKVSFHRVTGVVSTSVTFSAGLAISSAS